MPLYAKNPILSWKMIATALFMSSAAFLLTLPPARRVQDLYRAQESVIISDRNGREILIKPNAKQRYARFVHAVPDTFAAMVVGKEDRFFWQHPGINPASLVRGAFHSLIRGSPSGTSTLTQQAVKNILGFENERTMRHKLAELWYAIALELHASKQDILTMYANSASFGNQTQGIEEAARYYFNAMPAALDESQSLSLVATLANPSRGFPGTAYNASEMRRLARILNLAPPAPETPAREPQPQERVSLTAFELAPLGIDCTTTCRTSLDASLTARLRSILKRNIESPSFASVNNGAIVVIATGAQENQLLAVVGSPDPRAAAGGYRINLAREPRPIGSTIKPFIYLKAFEKSARPYSLVEDQEYKYTIGTGYAFYPKNYDGAYRGTVTLHEALSNSLNVPSVKVLEYVGLDAFSSFLEGTLAFQPLQPLETYGLGIALGGLEMDLMTLANYFTLFPNEGALKPLRAVISPAGRAAPPALAPPMAAAGVAPQQVAAPETVALVNRILSDQMTRVNQFGLKSNLSLPTAHYAVKTGTSRDYHDSWAIGFTPDFVVGVWIGNHDNTPMFQVSGQSGAGKIWHEVMDIMLNSEYHKKNEFSFSSLREFTESGSIEYGLPADHYDTQRYALGGAGDIMTPHQGDIFLFDPAMTLPFKARAAAQWTVNGTVVGAGEKILWKPEKPGNYRITARMQEREESVSITIERQDAALR